MLDRVVSGGQTGADQAGWRAARASGIATGGWMPAGLPDRGRAPARVRRDVRGRGAAGGGYPERTRANARDSDATVWFGDPESPGGRTTLRACTGFGKPVYLVIEGLTQPVGRGGLDRGRGGPGAQRGGQPGEHRAGDRRAGRAVPGRRVQSPGSRLSLLAARRFIVKRALQAERARCFIVKQSASSPTGTPADTPPLVTPGSPRGAALHREAERL